MDSPEDQATVAEVTHLMNDDLLGMLHLQGMQAEDVRAVRARRLVLPLCDCLGREPTH